MKCLIIIERLSGWGVRTLYRVRDLTSGSFRFVNSAISELWPTIPYNTDFQQWACCCTSKAPPKGTTRRVFFTTLNALRTALP